MVVFQRRSELALAGAVRIRWRYEFAVRSFVVYLFRALCAFCFMFRRLCFIFEKSSGFGWFIIKMHDLFSPAKVVVVSSFGVHFSSYIQCGCNRDTQWVKRLLGAWRDCLEIKNCTEQSTHTQQLIHPRLIEQRFYRLTFVHIFRYIKVNSCL